MKRAITTIDVMTGTARRCLFGVTFVLWMSLACSTRAADASLLKGYLALQDGFHDVAERALLSVVKQTSADASERQMAADLMLLSYVERNATDLLRSSIQQYVRDDVLPEEGERYWRGRLYAMEGDDDRALVELSSFVTETGRHTIYASRGLRKKALLHYKTGDPSRSALVFQILDRTHTNMPMRAYHRLDWGLMELASQRFENAVDVLEWFRDATFVPTPLAEDAHYWLARSLLLVDRVEAAQSLLETLAANRDMDEARWMRAILALAESYRLQGKGDVGTERLSDAINQTASPAIKKKARFALAYHLLDNQQPESAAERIRGIAMEYPDASGVFDLFARLGAAWLSSGRYDEADQVFQQMLEAFGDEKGLTYRGRGKALQGMGRDAEAALMFERASEIDSDEVLDNLYRAGEAYFRAGQYQRAMATFDRFVEVSPEDDQRTPLVLFRRAEGLTALGQRERALEAFEAIAHLYHQDLHAAEALLRAAALHVEDQSFDEAIVLYETVMQVFQDAPAYWHALHGRALARFQQWDTSALDDFERLSQAEDVKADLIEHAKFMKALSLYRLGRDEQALAVCKSFLENYPDSEWSPSVHFWMARFQYNMGDYEQAGQSFMSFVETFPQHELTPQGLYRAGMSAYRNQDYLTAIERFGQFVKEFPQHSLLSEVRFQQAESMVQLGRFSAAILLFEEVVNSAPGNELLARAWGRIGDSRFTLAADDPTRYDEAAQAYLAVLQVPDLRFEHEMQAASKLALTREKQGLVEEALEGYYNRVMLPFLLRQAENKTMGESARVWFSRSARAAAAIVEDRGDWRRLVRILERAVEADVDFATEARNRIRAVKAEYWWMFY